MKESNRSRSLAIILAVAMVASLLTGCGDSAADKKDKETITVCLWNNTLYETYAPYIQKQLPDVNIEFVVGNNDLDFYKFLNENGGLPDIITCCRFSLRDASPLKDNLMDLSTTNQAGAIYDTYLKNFTNKDGSVNWLPVAADAHGMVVNKGLFEKHNIPIPTDYDSFASACKAFEKVGIRGFDADYYYDYTCMETLQGMSASALSSTDGQKWRTAYSDPTETDKVGLDKKVWPKAFETFEQFIKDTGLNSDDITKNYDDIAEMFAGNKLAMYFGSSFGVQMYKDQGMDTTFLPLFNQNGEKWITTTPYFQIAMNKDLEKDETRKENAMKVLKVMMSADAQNIICNNQDTLSYSQDVPLKFTDALKDIRPVVEENHMYIRVASNDFFATSLDVVSKMISGKYDAKKAYESFNSQLLNTEETKEDTVLKSSKKYSNIFHNDGGNEAGSVMANSLRDLYGSDVLLSTANSFTGNVLKADYTEKQAGNMIMPNGILAATCKMTGAELRATAEKYVEGWDGGLTPFNKGSLPIASGISIEVKEGDDGFELTKVMKDGKSIKDDDAFTVTCIAMPQNIEALTEASKLKLKTDETPVEDAWVKYISGDKNSLAEPESYITLR